MQRGTFQVGLDEIIIGEGRRSVDETSVKRLAKSIKSIGLQHPITVRSEGGKFALIAGRHRLEAYRLLGEDSIPVDVVKMDKIDAEMWEISENLHRADLSVLERDTQVARWIELVEAKRVSRQPDAKSEAGRPEGGVRAAARELGVSEPDARRAVHVAGLSDEAKDAARETGLDNNRSALLEASRHESVAEQVAALQARANAVKPAPDPLNDIESAEKQLAALMSAWNRATGEVRDEFLLRIDRPVMDRRFG